MPGPQGWQTPAVHSSFDAQRVPQAPQFAVSDATFVQPAPQRAIPSAQAASAASAPPSDAPPCQSLG